MTQLTELLSNPYLAIGQHHADGLAAIESGLPETDFLISIMDFVTGIYYPSPDDETSAKILSISAHAIQGYIYNDYGGLYNAKQMSLIKAFLKALHTSPIDSLPTVIASVNEEIKRADMSMQEKVPLYFATAVALKNHEYWTGIINEPGNWESYLTSNEAINYANIPYWIEAAVIGTLVCSSKAGDYELTETPSVIGVDMVSALIGGLTMAADKVINKSVPRFDICRCKVLPERDC